MIVVNLTKLNFKNDYRNVNIRKKNIKMNNFRIRICRTKHVCFKYWMTCRITSKKWKIVNAMIAFCCLNFVDSNIRDIFWTSVCSWNLFIIISKNCFVCNVNWTCSYKNLNSKQKKICFVIKHVLRCWNNMCSHW